MTLSSYKNRHPAIFLYYWTLSFSCILIFSIVILLSFVILSFWLIPFLREFHQQIDYQSFQFTTFNPTSSSITGLCSSIDATFRWFYSIMIYLFLRPDAPVFIYRIFSSILWLGFCLFQTSIGQQLTASITNFNVLFIDHLAQHIWIYFCLSFGLFYQDFKP